MIAVPSEKYPLITGDLYQLFDTSDLPGGAVNIVTGIRLAADSSRLPNTMTSMQSGAMATRHRRLRKSDVDRKLEAGLDQRRTRIDWFDPKVAEGRWYL